MIFLIDDTPVRMLEEYLNPSDYEDVLKRLEGFSSDDVFSLTNASCVLLHSSYHDARVKREVPNYLGYGDIAPVVLFSDGDDEEAQFNGDNYIISIKKRVLYSRLPKLLAEFRRTRRVNLRILAGEEGDNAGKAPVKTGSGSVFSDFFSLNKLKFEPEPKEDKPAGPRVYCVGRDGMEKLARSVNGLFVSASPSSLKDSDTRIQDAKIHDFLSSAFPEEVKALVLDTDADPGLFMRLALHFRLMETLPRSSHFAPIVFVSDLKLEKLVKKATGGQVFMTDGVYLCQRSSLAESMASYVGLDADSYRGGFLDRISIPAPEGSNHSLANQWGASRLYMIIKGQKAEKDAFKDFQDIHKDLYFKYVMQRIPPSTKTENAGTEEYRVRRCTGKRILLIDDEAEKGWTKTLSLLFPMSRFDRKESVVSESVMDYEELSEGAKQKIESGDYDLILLDLRLGGIREDYVVVPEDMSGYKVLKKIKELNRGTQVIMLTASNKAWNLKAIMRPGYGADGYFVKESPEYEFSDELSAENLRSLIKDAERCLQRGYMRSFWSFVQSFGSQEDKLVQEVRAQLDIAFDMADRADTQEQFPYAYLALYQVLEMVASSLTECVTNTDPKCPNTKLLLINGSDPIREIVHPSGGEIITRQKPYAFHTVAKTGIFPVKDKLAALYLQKWEKQDHGVLFLMGQLVAIRNAVIHPENSKGFDLASPVREATLRQSKYFQDASLVFNKPDFMPLFQEAASLGLLYADSGGRPTLHKDVVNSSLGIRFLLACLYDFLPSIQP